MLCMPIMSVLCPWRRECLGLLLLKRVTSTAAALSMLFECSCFDGQLTALFSPTADVSYVARACRARRSNAVKVDDMSVIVKFADCRDVAGSTASVPSVGAACVTKRLVGRQTQAGTRTRCWCCNLNVSIYRVNSIPKWLAVIRVNFRVNSIPKWLAVIQVTCGSELGKPALQASPLLLPSASTMEPYAARPPRGTNARLFAAGAHSCVLQMR